MLDAGQHVHEYSTPTRKTCALATCSARAATSTDGVLRPPCRLSGGATASAVHRLQVERQERARCSCPAVAVGLAMWWAAAAAARAGRPPEQRGCARGDGRAHQVIEGYSPLVPAACVGVGENSEHTEHKLTMATKVLSGADKLRNWWTGCSNEGLRLAERAWFASAVRTPTTVTEGPTPAKGRLSPSRESSSRRVP